MVSRRHVLFTSTCGLLVPISANALTGRSLTFRITRKESDIGSHAVSFAGDPSNGNFTMTANVTVGVRVLGIRVFHYTHQAIEKWSGGKFVSLDATTDDDGEKAYATVRRTGDTLAVNGSNGKYTAPGNALAATHWNIDELKSPMINPENGRLIHAQISRPSHDTVALASGSKIAAQHFTWRGDQSLDLYYGSDNGWAGLTALAKDGSQLIYSRV